MASLLKPWIIRYVDSAGRQVSKGTPGAKKVKERAAKWYGQYTDLDGRRHRVPLCTDKVAARQMLAALERDVQLGRAGVLDPFAQHRNAPIDSHVADYEVHTRNKGVSAKTLSEDLRRLRAVLSGCGVRTLSDLRPESVERFLAALADRNAGASTRNSYLKSVKAFAGWCLRTRRMGENPLACLRAVQGEIRRRRRALTEDELARLLKATRERPLVAAMMIKRGPRRGRPEAQIKPETRAAIEHLGWEHSLIYKTLVYTGLRRGELEALEVRHLVLAGPRPCLVLPPVMTKNRSGANIPLRADLVLDLKQWIEVTRKSGPDRVFRVSEDLNKLLKRDLKWAGIPYRDEQGRTVDVHALRHTTATYLSRAKVSPRVAQGFMRHADIKLTMQTYTDASLLNEAEALAALPDLALKRDADV
jgi:integrase